MFLGWVLEYGGVAPLYINSVVVFDYRYKLILPTINGLMSV